MITLSQKERFLLEDEKKHEEICVEKYSKYSTQASGTQLKSLFQQLGQKEQEHLTTINQILSGTVPTMPAGGQQKQQMAPTTPDDNSNKKADEYLCTDALSTEKYVSGTYNTAIFEFGDTNVRSVLNHIQKEEQEHGEKIYNYMSVNGMYQG